jgi:hypothetical protein
MSAHVDRSDIERKLREIQGEVDDAVVSGKPAGIAVGASLVVGVVGLSYILGQRRARKQTTVVEIRRA